MFSLCSFNNLTDDQRRAIYYLLLEKYKSGKFTKGTMNDVANKYAMSKKIFFQKFGTMEKKVWNKELFMYIGQVVKKENSR